MTLDARDNDPLTRRSYYEATVMRPPADPPLQGNAQADVCVIGAGFAGLSAALDLRAKGFSVVVVDAHEPGWGASGRNGGQCLVGFAKDDTIIRELGDDAKRAWRMSVDAVSLVRERISKYSIDCDLTSGYLTVATHTKRIPELRTWMDTVSQRFDYSHLTWVDDANDHIDTDHYLSGVHDSFSGHLHPLKYCLGLADAVRRSGARLYAHTPVTQIVEGARPRVRTAHGDIECNFVVVAGNASIGRVLPKVHDRIAPIGSFIVATERMDPDRASSLVRDRAAVCDNNFFLDYYRVSADDRLLFGGRATTAFVEPDSVAPILRQRMLMVYPQLADLKIEYTWGGFVDVTRNRAPDFGRIAPNIYYLQGFSGHGVALTGIAGRIVAEAIAGQAGSFDLFTKIKHQRFPGGEALRRPVLEVGFLYHRLREALGV
ncbi:MAG TPA: FAD-binding oxidoreductase [Pararobbsia sp.]|jgi:glycine/D-amino acid oxidase-like deaminating enzyme|nr:FAD-binding oxidoreductase [Pararobbsia sp.]